MVDKPLSRRWCGQEVQGCKDARSDFNKVESIRQPLPLGTRQRVSNRNTLYRPRLAAPSSYCATFLQTHPDPCSHDHEPHISPPLWHTSDAVERCELSTLTSDPSSFGGSHHEPPSYSRNLLSRQRSTSSPYGACRHASIR
jgi:hypothetical protein